MILTPGTRLGPYEILTPLGAGGMGEVFRARDTKLGRDVAIKVLPEAFASDHERLARFRREAHILASLNHPNIAAIHGLEESVPSTGSGTGVTGAEPRRSVGTPVCALVMELVTGEDLAERLRRGAIPVDEAIAIAKQIAEALEEAHEHGIVHRDLKPANIKVTPEGKVKVLDFGLAKALEAAPGLRPAQPPGATDAELVEASPTMSRHGTETGVILGTAAYMSPEQARGKPVDKRADIWSFGVVLFEMLTGKRLFEGETVSDVLAAVLKTEPDFAALPAGLSPRIHRLLDHCLRKDPRQRLHDVADARIELTEEEPASALSAVGPPRGGANRPANATRLPWALVVALSVALIAAFLASTSWRPAPALPETRTEISTPATDAPTSFALSPDGRHIVFVASGEGGSRLWLRSLATTTAQPLAGTERSSFPFWSSDSRSVGFFADGKLKLLDIGGGASQTVATGDGRGGTWNADGVILFAPSSSSPLFRVPASGGPSVAVTRLEGQPSHRYPSFLPDGRHFLFYAQGTDTAGIYLGALDAPETRRLTPADAAGVYMSPGWLLWVRAGSLVAQHLDLAHGALTGDSVTLANPVMVNPTVNEAAVSVSVGGLVAYRTGVGRRRQLTWVDRSGQALGPLGSPDDSGLMFPSVSTDGRRAVVSRRVQTNTDLWLLDGIHMSRFTSDPAGDVNPIWSPDGRRIVFDSSRKGHRDLYRGSSSRASAEDLLLASPQDKVATDWSADYRFLLYQSNDPQTGWDLWALPMPWVFLKTPFDERFGTFSPDGRWVAYMSNESGRGEIYVRPFTAAVARGAIENAAGAQQVSTAGGIFPRWRRDGQELYYLDPAGAMMAASINVTGATLEAGAPVMLFATRIYGSGADRGGGRQYDVTGDGRFLINTVPDEVPAPITLLMNWNPEVKK